MNSFGYLSMAITIFHVLDILSYPVSVVGFTMVEPREIFKMKVHEKAGKCYFDITSSK